MVRRYLDLGEEDKRKNAVLFRTIHKCRTWRIDFSFMQSEQGIKDIFRSKVEGSMKEYKYILDGHKPVLCKDPMMWAKTFESQYRVVAQTKKGDVEVSTVFLGLDYNFGSSPPSLFETMVFGGKHDGGSDRYSTWEEAVQGHLKMCEMVLSSVMLLSLVRKNKLRRMLRPIDE